MQRKLTGHVKKKLKRTKIAGVPILIGAMQIKRGTPKGTKIKILLDSGASSTIVKKSLTTKLKRKKDPSTVWNTASGNFTTTERCKVHVLLPELSPTLAIESTVYVADNLTNYDMIMGRDLLTELGIDLSFKRQCIDYIRALTNPNESSKL